MSERVWTGLPALAADGLACVICGRSFRFRGSPVRLPVGRSHNGLQVFACARDCADRATAMPETLAIPMEALSAGGAAFLAFLAVLAVLAGAGGDVHRADPDDLVTETVRAAAPLVVAAELRGSAPSCGPALMSWIPPGVSPDEPDKSARKKPLRQ